MTTLTIEQLSTGYGGGTVLADVSLRVDPGTIHTVIGPNGAGKTTLINTIAGFHPATSGIVRLGDRDITTMPAHRRARLGIRVVPQGGRLFAHLNIDEHLDLAATGQPDGRAAIATMLDTLPALAARRRHYPDQLSGGEAQMLAVVRALLGQPRLLLLDEPTDGLSPAVTAIIARMTTDTAAQDVGVLITASRRSDIPASSSQITHLRLGRITTTPRDGYLNPVTRPARDLDAASSQPWTDLLNIAHDDTITHTEDS